MVIKLIKWIIGITSALVLFIYLLLSGMFGNPRPGPAEPADQEIPKALIQQRQAAQLPSGFIEADTPIKQILFGDLHVHTTYSKDAFFLAIPLIQGEGAHPVSDACDFARFCSGLDFWSINDHAESLTPEMWLATKDSVRQCNAATDPENPDLVAFLGWEWTQKGDQTATYYGHKNVVLKDIDEADVISHPIATTEKYTGNDGKRKPVPWVNRIAFSLLDLENLPFYMDYFSFTKELSETPACPKDVAYGDLPDDCILEAATPKELFARLDEWGGDSIVIPHGNSWGAMTPRDASWDKQLVGGMHDETRQTLIEVYSGHGNAEEYRSWRHVTYNEKGEPVCPEKTDKFTPGCQQAGDIIRKRCRAEGESHSECEQRTEAAQQHYLGINGPSFMAVPGTRMEDWLDSAQCLDCFLPPFEHRPLMSTQYALAVRNFDDPENPRSFRFGLIGSSDNHSARAGTGYKQINRTRMTDVAGARDETFRNLIGKFEDPPVSRSRSWKDRKFKGKAGLLNEERVSSFYYTGGLVAVHAPDRTRDEIWQALKRKEVYATSGERILLWFDLLNGGSSGDKSVPMGGEIQMDHSPQFQVKAVGAFKQQPGCPENSINSLSGDRLNRLCQNECYHPSDERKLITRIEVVRIRPQSYKGEPVDDLVEDPWRTFKCSGDPDGCQVEFQDPDFEKGRRDTVYYVRAIEETTPTINAGNYRISYDQDRKPQKTDMCYGGYRTDSKDDCLADAEPRAWSSPIFVDFAR